MKKFLGKILTFLGCKDLSLMKYGLEHGNWKLFFDGIFFGKYQYVGKFQGTPLEHAKNFIEYFKDPTYKKNLIKGLDKTSRNTVNIIEKNIKWILSEDKKSYIKKSDFGINENDREIEKYIKEYTRDILLPLNKLEQTVFYYKHGIRFVENIKESLKGKDIIDCGAFIGDSAMMFSKELGFIKGNGILDKIYCLEPEPTNKKLLDKTIRLNKKEGKIIPIPLGLSKEMKTLYINFNGAASTIGAQNNTSHIIKVDTIDNIVKNYNINPGMIKRDIEGLEYDSILGAKETIKEYQPILLISIYHNGRDFYEIKPLLESWNLGYTFKIRHLSTHLFEETMLICY